MRLITALALAIGLLIAVPYWAHRLRRKRADVRPFAPAKLVQPTPPNVRQKARLDDRALLALRALSILMLALLGASPLVRCSRLSLSRTSGASVAVAIVVDDSMSMREKRGNTSKFDRAIKGAEEILASAREGDSIAIVLGGAPPRVALASTTDIAAGKATLDGLHETDRGTDLEGALKMASGLLEAMPQVDHRVVLLSDLADGHPDEPPLGRGATLPLWFPLPDLVTRNHDCGILAADRAGPRVHVHVGCGAVSETDREVAIMLERKVVARAPVPRGVEVNVSLTLPSDEPGELQATLSGEDAVAADDVAYVVTEGGPGAIAVIGDSVERAAVTGGAPVLEQALAALSLGMAIRPIPALPDRAEDLAAFAGIIFDDPPGFTPEQRHVLGSFLEGRGVVLLALGARAASAPLGASFEPILEGAIHWVETRERGADASSAKGGFLESAESLVALNAPRRITLGPEDARQFEALVAWTDGPFLFGRREVKGGEAWVVTLPFSVESSDLTLRPGFLTLLDAWVEKARGSAAPRRTEVGTPWNFQERGRLSGVGPSGPVMVVSSGSNRRVIPERIGVYRMEVDGKKEVRVASPVEGEMNLRPRALASRIDEAKMGESRSFIDMSPMVALVLLALLAGESALRLRARVHADA